MMATSATTAMTMRRFIIGCPPFRITRCVHFSQSPQLPQAVLAVTMLEYTALISQNHHRYTFPRHEVVTISPISTKRAKGLLTLCLFCIEQVRKIGELEKP